MGVFYVCGTDHAKKCRLTQGILAVGVVIVPRAGDTVPTELADKNVFVAEAASDEIAEFSSTRVREAIRNKDEEYMRKAMSAEAASFLLNPSKEQLQDFEEDFNKLG